jgi:hypothetical protein
LKQLGQVQDFYAVIAQFLAQGIVLQTGFAHPGQRAQQQAPGLPWGNALQLRSRPVYENCPELTDLTVRAADLTHAYPPALLLRGGV